MKQLISCGRSSCSHSSMPQYVHTMWTTHLLRCLPNPAPQGHKALPHDHNAPTHCTLIIPHATNCSRFRKVQSGGERERKNRGEWGMGEILIPLCIWWRGSRMVTLVAISWRVGAMQYAIRSVPTSTVQPNLKQESTTDCLKLLSNSILILSK